MTEVRIGAGAAKLAAAGAPIARAEGFEVHAESMEARVGENADRHEPHRHDRAQHRRDRRAGLTLTLEGTGAGTRNTGVGFLDHMLDLLARHGHLDLDVTVTGDLQTGAHHTAEDTAIVLGQALDEALGDRAGIARYGAATVPMDEARASCAIDISGRPFTLFEAELPPGSTGGFEHELTEEFFRALANAAKLTLHLRVETGSNAHHMIEAAFKAFARALRQAVAIDPTETGRAQHEGHADRMSERVAPLVTQPVEIAIVDYGMGNRRSVEKALEHVGARATITQRPRAAARPPPASCCPASAPSRARWPTCASSASTSCCASAVAAGTPVLGICLGMQLAFESSERARRRGGPGAVPGEVRAAADHGELKLPHIGWNEVTLRRARLAAARGAPERCAFYHVHSLAPVPADERDVLGTAEYGAPFVTAVQRGSLLRRPVPPREVLRRRAAPARQLRRASASPRGPPVAG